MCSWNFDELIPKSFHYLSRSLHLDRTNYWDLKLILDFFIPHWNKDNKYEKFVLDQGLWD